MPLYEYECEKCKKRFELRRGITDKDDKLVCPVCGAKDPHRIFSAFSTGYGGGACEPSGSG
jgi:putative FmdB family regulatory protein